MYGDVNLSHSDIQGGWECDGYLDVYPAFKDTSQGDNRLIEYSVYVGRGKDSVLVEGTVYYYPSTDQFDG